MGGWSNFLAITPSTLQRSSARAALVPRNREVLTEFVVPRIRSCTLRHRQQAIWLPLARTALLCALELFFFPFARCRSRSCPRRLRICQKRRDSFVFRPLTTWKLFFVTRANFTLSAKTAASRDG